MSYFKVKLKAVDDVVDPIVTKHKVVLKDPVAQQVLNKAACTLCAEVVQRLEFYGDKSEQDLREFAENLATAIAKAG